MEGLKLTAAILSAIFLFTFFLAWVTILPTIGLLWTAGWLR